MSTERYDWAAMRADIESGRVRSFAELSAKYGATEQAIRNRRKADAKNGDPWPSPQIARAKPNVIDLSKAREHIDRSKRGGRSSSGKDGQSARGEADADDLTAYDEPLDFEQQDVDPLEEQQKLGVMAQRAARRGLRRYMRGAIRPGMNQSEADVLNALLTASKNAIMINREIAGKGKGEASADGADDIEPVELVIRTERIAPANRAEVVEQRKEAS